MRRFDGVLRSVADRLDLPQPARLRILEEIAEDLEDLRAELVRRGVNEEEAERAAVKLLAPSDAAVDALVGVHEPFHHALVRRFSSTRLRRFEGAAILAIFILAMGVVGGPLIESGLLREPSAFLYPNLFLLSAMVVAASAKAVRLFLVRDHKRDKLREGLSGLLFGSALAVGLSLAGFLVELAKLARAIETSPAQTAALIVPWLRDSAFLIGGGLCTALVGGLFWVLLLQKVTAVERAYVREETLTGGGVRVPSLSLD